MRKPRQNLAKPFFLGSLVEGWVFHTCFMSKMPQFLALSSSFQLKAEKMLKRHILTSIGSEQHWLVKIYSKYDSLNCDFKLRKKFINIYKICTHHILVKLQKPLFVPINQAEIYQALLSQYSLEREFYHGKIASPRT